MPGGPTETDLRMTRTPVSVAAPLTGRITTATVIIITIISRIHPICRISSHARGSPTSCWFWRTIRMSSWVCRESGVTAPPGTSCLHVVGLFIAPYYRYECAYAEHRVTLFIACLQHGALSHRYDIRLGLRAGRRARYRNAIRNPIRNVSRGSVLISL